MKYWFPEKEEMHLLSQMENNNQSFFPQGEINNMDYGVNDANGFYKKTKSSKRYLDLNPS